MAKETILVVDDEANIIELAKMYLQNEGYVVESARDGQEALTKIESLQPALVVLDLMLPEVDGWEVCRKVRAGSNVPIIMLTARSDDVDKIVGLELGADDYLTKPFNPRELVARVKAVLRRYEKNTASTQPIHLGQVTIDPQRREVTVGGQQLGLRTKEFDLLWAMAEHRGIVLSRDQLLDLVWGYDYYGETRTVDVHIAHLRDKLEGSNVAILRPFQIRLAYINLIAKIGPTTRLVRELARGGSTPEEIGTQLKEQAQEDGTRIFVLTPQGKVLADTDDKLIGQQLQVPTREMQREGQLPYLRGQLTTPDGESIIYAALPTAALRGPAGGEQRLIVAVTMARPRAVNFLGDLLIPLLFAGLIAFVISILLAYLIARSIAKPLQRITLATEEIARGDYDQQLNITSPDEVHRLATSFNVMAQEVKASRQAQRDFVANVSHELKTPLTSIQGFSQAILDGTASDSKAQHHAAQIINDEAERMARLVNELLDLAKMDAGQIVMAQEPVVMGQLLRGCVEKLTPQAVRGGVELRLDLETLPPLSGDNDWLAQVFTNLVDNALKHTPQGGRVTVAAREVTGQPAHKGEKAIPRIEVSVADTGSGIPPEDLSRIFERFYQVDKSRHRKDKGAGLGLAIAKEIVQAHGGQIKAESVVGVGTKFTVTLPVGMVVG
jgi:signal transduction histidine kinase